MGYNRKNHLLKVIKVQEIYLTHKVADMSNRYVFNKYVADVFHITECTFYNWLAVKNPKKQLKEIIENESKAALK